jgi:hypothetical protein
VIHLCRPKLYEFEGLLIEYGFSGVWPCKKDGDPYVLLNYRVTDKVNRFMKLTDEEREKLRVGGGCVTIE